MGGTAVILGSLFVGLVPFANTAATIENDVAAVEALPVITV